MVLEDTNAGFHPFVLIASCGTTSIGAVDPIAEMDDITATHQMWCTLQVLRLDEMGRMIDHGFRLAECSEAEFRKLDS